MNRTILALVGLLAIGVFASLAYYGWVHRYGSPETYEPNQPLALVVPFYPRPLELGSGDVTDDVWQRAPGADVPLLPQMSERPWPTGLVPAVHAQAFHDGNDIYFRLAWEDDVADRVLAVDRFTDGCAVAVPLDTAGPVQSIMMGFSSPVNIWHWRASADAQVWQGAQPARGTEPDFTYPFESEETLPVSKPQVSTAVADLLAQRAGSLTRKDRQIVQGRGQWDDGVWAVVLKRSLRTENAQRDCQFEPGRCPVSFAVWDGDQAHRGSRKFMSEWVIFDIQAEEKSEIRNPKLETNSKPKTQNPKWTIREATAFRSFGFRSFGFGSDFDVRISKLGTLAAAQPQPELINVVAKRFSYTPSRITVRKGQRVTLRLESLDVTHGLYLDGYGIDLKARPGMVGKATFTADKAGRFTFRCSETCGEFHPYMVGFFEVTPNRRFSLFAAGTGVAFLAILSLVVLGAVRQRRLRDDAANE